MSFIPVREALQRLEAERMVRWEHNRGATVTELSIADMHDIYETRLVLEAAAVRAATPRLSPVDLDVARHALNGMGERFRAGDDPQAYAWHQKFHFALYEPADSPWTMHLIRLLWSSAERYMRLAASVRPEPEGFVAEHAEILGAVEAGDADGAAERLADNLRTTSRLLAETYVQARRTTMTDGGSEQARVRGPHRRRRRRGRRADVRPPRHRRRDRDGAADGPHRRRRPAHGTRREPRRHDPDRLRRPRRLRRSRARSTCSRPSR